jgi:hypothetical protein
VNARGDVVDVLGLGDGELASSASALARRSGRASAGRDALERIGGLVGGSANSSQELASLGCSARSRHPESRFEQGGMSTRASGSSHATPTPGLQGTSTRRLDPAKPGEMSQVSGGEVEAGDVVGDRLVESVEVAA